MILLCNKFIFLPPFRAVFVSAAADHVQILINKQQVRCSTYSAIANEVNMYISTALNHWIFQNANPAYFNSDLVTGLQKFRWSEADSDSRRSTCGYNVTRHQ